jgi:hypothetical protein
MGRDEMPDAFQGVPVDPSAVEATIRSIEEKNG